MDPTHLGQHRRTCCTAVVRQAGIVMLTCKAFTCMRVITHDITRDITHTITVTGSCHRAPEHCQSGGPLPPCWRLASLRGNNSPSALLLLLLLLLQLPWC